jgi:hypothetical protein
MRGEDQSSASASHSLCRPLCLSFCLSSSVALWLYLPNSLPEAVKKENEGRRPESSASASLSVALWLNLPNNQSLERPPEAVKSYVTHDNRSYVAAGLLV